jgi:hypothetical protein
MFAIQAGCMEELLDLRERIDPRADGLLADPRQRGFDFRGGAAEHVLVEETQRADRAEPAAGRELSVAQQVQQILFEFMVGHLIRRAFEMPGQAEDRADVGKFGVEGEPAQVEFVDEFLAECCHRPAASPNALDSSGRRTRVVPSPHRMA